MRAAENSAVGIIGCHCILVKHAFYIGLGAVLGDADLEDLGFVRLQVPVSYGHGNLPVIAVFYLALHRAGSPAAGAAAPALLPEDGPFPGISARARKFYVFAAAVIEMLLWVPAAAVVIPVIVVPLVVVIVVIVVAIMVIIVIAVCVVCAGRGDACGGCGGPITQKLCQSAVRGARAADTGGDGKNGGHDRQ